MMDALADDINTIRSRIGVEEFSDDDLEQLAGGNDAVLIATTVAVATLVSAAAASAF